MSSSKPQHNPADRDRGSSAISGLYKQSQSERLEELVHRGFLSADEAASLESGGGLDINTADSMIENVIGVFGLPIGIGTNLQVNGKDYVVPMVVEEPSIVAAVSHSAKIIRNAGGFEASTDQSVMTGQIQVVNLSDADAAAKRILAAKDELLEKANQLEASMVRRGGGAVGIETRVIRRGLGSEDATLVVHLHFNVCDAMGANLINTLAEKLAPDIERLSGGVVMLRILTNLTDQRCARARCSIPIEQLAWQGFSGHEIADGIVHASEFAESDPWRAATHNKGIMNGIDAVAIATGQDWRAIEAGAHAYAARTGQYRPLATWKIKNGTHLCGEIELPMAVGIVGGPIRLHPTVKILLKMLNVDSASELGMVIASVGLAQNLAAIKALGSTGIQKGHMALHARSVAATAGACGDEIEHIACQMIDDGQIRVDHAKALLDRLRAQKGDT